MGNASEAHRSRPQGYMTNDRKNWEEWVRTLANSTNPRDTDLLVVKIGLLFKDQKEEVREKILSILDDGEIVDQWDFKRELKSLLSSLQDPIT